MPTTNNVYVAMCERGEGVVHFHRVDLFDDGAVGVVLHERCMPKAEFFRIKGKFAIDGGYDSVVVNDIRRRVWFFFHTQDEMIQADEFTYRALIATGEYDDEQN